MRRVVVVATARIDRDDLDGIVEPEDEAHVIVAPAVEQSRLQWLANDEDEARGRAERLGEEIAELAPASSSGVGVKPDLPSQVVRDAIAEHEPDHVFLAVRAGDEASWLEEGELDRLPSEIDGVPVTRLAL